MYLLLGVPGVLGASDGGDSSRQGCAVLRLQACNIAHHLMQGMALMAPTQLHLTGKPMHASVRVWRGGVACCAPAQVPVGSAASA